MWRSSRLRWCARHCRLVAVHPQNHGVLFVLLFALLVDQLVGAHEQRAGFSRLRPRMRRVHCPYARPESRSNSARISEW